MHLISCSYRPYKNDYGIISLFSPVFMISESFWMQHVTLEGLALVKQAEDAASNKKVVNRPFFLRFYFFFIVRSV